MNNQTDNLTTDTYQDIAVDLGPLAWVVQTLRDTLAQADADLAKFSAEVAEASGSHVTTLDTAPLRHASQGLHEAVGVLGMVEQPAAARVVSAMEAAVHRFVSNPELTTDNAVATLRDAGHAVADYLTSVLQGNADLAPGLYPFYAHVAKLAGMERIHPADLWIYEWRWLETPDFPVPEEIPAATLQTAFLRSALSAFKTNGQEGLPALAQAGQQIAVYAPAGHAKVFWQLFAAVAQALAAGALHFDAQIKLLLANVISHFSAWLSGQENGLISDRVAQDMLYFSALGASRLVDPGKAPATVAVVRVYGLEKTPIAGYDQPLYGVLDRQRSEEIKAQLVSFRELWSDVAASDVRKLPRLHEVAGTFIESIGTLWPDCAILGKSIWRVVDALQQSGMPPSSDLGMEMATTILFLEASLSNYQPADALMAARSQELSKRLTAVLAGQPMQDLAPWMRELYMRMSDSDTMRHVVTESRTALSEIEQALDQFFRTPQEASHAQAALPKLDKMGSSLAMLGFDSASRAVYAMHVTVQHLMTVATDPLEWMSAENQAQIERVADSLGTLSFLLEMLEYQPGQVKRQFYFDEARQELVHRPSDKRSATQETAAQPAPDSYAVAAPEGASAGAELDFVVDALAPAVAVEAPVVQPSAAAQVAESVTDTTATAPVSSAPAAAAPAASEEAAPSPAPAAPAAYPDDGIVDVLIEEEDLREIFLEEVSEVLGNGQAAIGALRAHPDDQAQLTNLRRAFHTLKGSGRMVGLASFGEAAWEIERLLNGWLAEARPATPAVLDLCAQALEVMGEWREAIARGEKTRWHHQDFKRAVLVLQTQQTYEPIRSGADVPPAAEVPVPEAAPPAPTAAPAQQEQAAPQAASMPDAAPPMAPEAADRCSAQQPEAEFSAAVYNAQANPIVLTARDKQVANFVPSVPDALLKPQGISWATDNSRFDATTEQELTDVARQTDEAVQGLVGIPAAVPGQTIVAAEPVMDASVFAEDPFAPSPQPAGVPAAVQEEAPVNADAIALDDIFADKPSAPANTADAGIAPALDVFADPFAPAAPQPAAEQEEAPVNADAIALDDVFADPFAPVAPQPAAVQEEAPVNADAIALDDIFADKPSAPANTADAGITPALDVFADPFAPAAPQPAAVQEEALVNADAIALDDVFADPFAPVAPQPAAVQEEAPVNADAIALDDVFFADDVHALDQATHTLFAAGAVAAEQSAAIAPMAPASTPAQPVPEAATPPATNRLTSILVNIDSQRAVLADMVDGMPEDQVKRIGDIHIPIPLFQAYLSEADTWSRQLVTEISEWQLEHEKTAPESASHMAHSLAGSSATVGLAGLASVARGIEHAIDHLQQRTARPEEAATLVEAAEMVRQDLQHFAAGILQPMPMDMLHRLMDIIDDEAPPPPPPSAAPDTDDAALADLAFAVEPLPDAPQGAPKAPLAAARDADVFAPAAPEAAAIPPAVDISVLAETPEPPAADAFAPVTEAPAVQAPVAPVVAAAPVVEASPFADVPASVFAPEPPAPAADVFAPVAEVPVVQAPVAPVVAAAPVVEASPFADVPASVFAPEPPAPAADVFAPVAEAPVVQAPVAPVVPATPAVQDAIDPELFEIFHAEADELFPRLSAAMRQWTAQPTDQNAREQILRTLHTLKGSARLAGAMRLGAMAHDIETGIGELGTAITSADVLDPVQSQMDDMEREYERVCSIDHYQPAVQAADVFAPAAPVQAAPVVPPVVPSPVVQTPAPVVAPQPPVAAAPVAPAAQAAPVSAAPFVPPQVVPPQTAVAVPVAPQTLASVAQAPVAAAPAAPQAPAMAPATPAVQAAPVVAPAPAVLQTPAASTAAAQVQDAIDPELFEIFRAEADELFPRLSAAMRQWTAQPTDQNAREQILRTLHTLKGSARLAGAMRLGAMAHDIETGIGELGTAITSADVLDPVQSQMDDMEREYARVCGADEPQLPPQAAMPPVAAAQPAPPMPPLAAAPVVPVAPPVAPVAPPAVQAAVPAVQPAAPVVPPAQAAAPVFAPAPVPQAVAASVPPQAAAANQLSAVAMPVPTNLAAQKTALQQQVRVRANLLDRLLGQAGEVMTSRARLEGGLGHLRGALKDMDGSLERLRTQLREMEVQAESQMQSRLALSREQNANFDPLEFDRFTRVQELTRMMAESVNDVASVQRNILRTVQSTEDDLTAQARQTKALQDDLLRTRTVEFDSLSERLYRVVRQAAKESGKQVALDIVGASIEMDRSIIERIAPVFEHLLRNAVVHGVEAADQRARVGKAAVGNIVIDLHPEGNDVVIKLKDDGAGLNVLRIRDKAVTKGLLAPEARISDDQAAQLIFSSGLSTADNVTSLAGRGVGMDVVRNEINALGGRVKVHSQQNMGTEFVLTLPLTTAVTQVVELRMGDYRIGVPSHLIEAVRRATAKEIQTAYNTHAFRLGDEDVPFYWGGAMMQTSRRSEAAPAKYQVVVVLRSAAQRIVMHVDEVEGAHEVVVKNLGPQLARVPGLAGITVMPDGRLLYIYNPVALSYVYGALIHEFGADLADPDMLADGGKAAASGRTQPDLPPEPPLVMVVDDSITVRRVTERLLKREGYRVALAADGLLALKALADDPLPDIILSDIEMPQMDGFELLQNIRNNKRLHGIPVIMITSRTADKHREHAQELGATGFLGKPYPEEQLLKLIAHHTGREQPAVE